MKKRKESASPPCAESAGQSKAARRFSDLSSDGAKAAARTALESISETRPLEDPTVPPIVSRNDDAPDDVSAMTTMSAGAELYFKYLPHAISRDVPKNFESEEQKLMEVQDLANLPTVEQFLKVIVEAPRSSVLVQMGEQRLKSAAKSLLTEISKWELCVETYRIEEANELAAETEALKVRNETYEALTEAARAYHAMDIKYNTLVSARQESGKKKVDSERCAALGHLLRNAIQALLDKHHVPWAQDQDGLIDHIKKTLGIFNFKDCKKLNRAECLGIFHIMDMFGWDLTDFFQGLFDLPPNGITRVDFF